MKTLCNSEGTRIYCTMSKTKAAFTERTIRSRKKIVTTDTNTFTKCFNLAQPCSLEIARQLCYQKKSRNLDFVSILYSKPLKEQKTQVYTEAKVCFPALAPTNYKWRNPTNTKVNFKGATVLPRKRGQGTIKNLDRKIIESVNSQTFIYNCHKYKD